MSDEQPQTPQDSAATQPLAPTPPPNSEVSGFPEPERSETQEHLSPVGQETVAHPTVPAPVTASPVHPSPPTWAARPQVTYLPPPTGPNWGLVIVGLVFALVGAGVVANQLAGFEVSSVSEMGPSVLVIAGLACALLGIIGILTRRRRG